MKKWYVDSAGTAIDWSAAVVSSVATEDIFLLTLADGARTPGLHLFAAAGQPVTGDQVSRAQAATSGDAIPTRTQSTDADAPTAHSGASEQFAPCWFQTAEDLSLSDEWAACAWAALDDGIDAGADVVVDGGDATLLSIVNTGIYRISVVTAPLTAAETAGRVVTCGIYLAHNDDSAGPASDVAAASLHVGPNCRSSASLSFELPLTAGDTLNLNVRQSNAQHTTVLGSGYGTIVVTRIS